MKQKSMITIADFVDSEMKESQVLNTFMSNLEMIELVQQSIETQDQSSEELAKASSATGVQALLNNLFSMGPAEEENAPPTISSIYVHNTEVNPGERVDVQFYARDYEFDDLSWEYRWSGLHSEKVEVDGISDSICASLKV